MMGDFFKKMIGGDRSPPRKSHPIIGWSFLGAFIGIYIVSSISIWLPIDAFDRLFLVGSFGASAVLLYGAPQAEFSQPRNLIGGHVISAIVGVIVYKLIPLDVELLSAIAVSMSIVAMHYTVTVHPPGGATALIAVIGGDKIHDLGYTYVVLPIGVGAILMLLVALVVNNFSSNQTRHYPRYWL